MARTGSNRAVDVVDPSDARHDSTPAGSDGDQVEEEFRSLLEGLRTTLPGVQLVTAFLLTVPLYDKYDQLMRSERVAYYIAFTSALVASLLLTAPSSHQRLRARDGEGVARRHRHHLDVAVRLTIVGSALFAVAITAVAYLVSSIVLGTPWSLAVTGAIVATWAWSWYYLPLVTFRRDS
jgi:hypothetical protein